MLMNRKIVSDDDNERLVAAVAEARSSWITYAPCVDYFGGELRRARVLPPSDVPPDVITMHSRFTLGFPKTGEVGRYTLVYPNEEALPRGMISVLSPMGQALLGARVGDEVTWMTSIGWELATVEGLLHQPEAAGRLVEKP